MNFVEFAAEIPCLIAYSYCHEVEEGNELRRGPFLHQALY